MRRGAAAATGIAVAAIYVLSAAWSGHLSPLARRPILDGVAPSVPYRWAEPPPELASTNLAPASGAFRVELGNRGSVTKVFTTDDAQVTVILSARAFPPSEDQRSIEITIAPLGASEVSLPGRPLQILGNVYRIEATYVPSGDAAGLRSDARIVLVYPFSTTLHRHEVVVSTDGEAWTAVDTNDLPSIQQADGVTSTLGYVAIAGSPGSPAPPPAGAGGGSNAATIAIVAGLAVLTIGTVIALRPRKGDRPGGRKPPSRPGRGSARGSRRSR